MCSSVFAGPPAALAGRCACSTPAVYRGRRHPGGRTQAAHVPTQHTAAGLCLASPAVFMTFESFPKPGLDVPGATCCPLVAFCCMTICAGVLVQPRSRGAGTEAQLPWAVTGVWGLCVPSLSQQRPVWRLPSVRCGFPPCLSPSPLQTRVVFTVETWAMFSDGPPWSNPGHRCRAKRTARSQHGPWAPEAGGLRGKLSGPEFVPAACRACRGPDARPPRGGCPCCIRLPPFLNSGGSCCRRHWPGTGFHTRTLCFGGTRARSSGSNALLTQGHGIDGCRRVLFWVSSHTHSPQGVACLCRWESSGRELRGQPGGHRGRQHRPRRDQALRSGPALHPGCSVKSSPLQVPPEGPPPSSSRLVFWVWWKDCSERKHGVRDGIFFQERWSALHPIPVSTQQSQL